MVKCKEQVDTKKILFFGTVPNDILSRLDQVNYTYDFITFDPAGRSKSDLLSVVCDEIKHATLVVIMWSGLSKVESSEAGILAKLARQFYVSVWLIAEEGEDRSTVLEYLVNEVGTMSELVDCVIEYYKNELSELSCWFLTLPDSKIPSRQNLLMSRQKASMDSQ